MSSLGRPTTLDDEQRNTIASLVASGVSIRQAARFVDTSPRTIQREAQRNDQFRHRLIQAKSEATVHPMQTLHEAARTNWRAALCVAERLDPERFARSNTVTQREANQFATDLVAAIEQGVSDRKARRRVQVAVRRHAGRHAPPLELTHNPQQRRVGTRRK
jgi:IS30 family transposase